MLAKVADLQYGKKVKDGKEKERCNIAIKVKGSASSGGGHPAVPFSKVPPRYERPWRSRICTWLVRF